MALGPVKDGDTEWAFAIEGGFETSRDAILPGEVIEIHSQVRNRSSAVGTVYVIVRIADSFDSSRVVYDSDKRADRQRRRLVDIDAGELRPFSALWRSPANARPGHYDVSLEVWTPAKLYRRAGPHCFDVYPWRGAFVVAGSPRAGELRERHRVFVSYAGHSPEHVAWVKSLGDELKLSGVDVVADYADLRPGSNITAFMQALEECDTYLVVCSETYLQRAKTFEVGTGAGFEAKLLLDQFYKARDRKTFIALLRDGPEGVPFDQRTPAFLAGYKVIDMERPDWRNGPLNQLLDVLGVT